MSWKFSWGPWHGGVAVYDPPHGDYYSKPSQPTYQDLIAQAVNSAEAALLADAIIARDRAALVAKSKESDKDRDRAHSLVRQSYQEPTARALYNWLGRDAENF